MVKLTLANKMVRITRQCLGGSKYHDIVAQYKRGLYKDVFPSNESNEMAELLKKPQVVYAGFDPTADSLHLGNLLILIGLLHWQRSGHHVIAVVGSATAAVGDPSGRSPAAGARPIIVQDQLRANANGISECINRIFSNHREYIWKAQRQLGNVSVVDNSTWLGNVDAASFAGTVGRHLRLGQMLSRDAVRARLESDAGLSLAELCYQAFQAYDWLYLYRHYGCRFQLGGADQMGNITTGHELLSRAENARVYGLTMPLVTSEEGDKLGKSAGNAIWLSGANASPFQLYQFLLRRKDDEAARLLRLLTLEPEHEILELEKASASAPERRVMQRRLASQCTLLVHGARGLAEAKSTSEALYGGSLEALSRLSPGDAAAALRGANILRLPMDAATSVLDLAMAAGCFASEDDARRIMAAGGFHVNHKRSQNPSEVLTKTVHILPNNLSLIRVGKKNFYVVEWVP